MRKLGTWHVCTKPLVMDYMICPCELPVENRGDYLVRNSHELVGNQGISRYASCWVGVACIISRTCRALQYLIVHEFHIIVANRSLIFGIKASRARFLGGRQHVSTSAVGNGCTGNIAPHQRNGQLFIMDVMLYSDGDKQHVTA